MADVVRAQATPDAAVVADGLAPEEATVPTDAPTSHPRIRRPSVPWLLGALVASVYTTLAVVRYRQFPATSFDLGIHTQVAGHYSRLEAPITDLEGPGTNYMGDHFSPILALLAVPYRIFPSSLTLLVVQALLLGLSVVPIARLALSRFGTVAGVAVALSYGLSWGLQSAAAFDFHEIAFAVPLLAFSLEAVVNKQWKLSVAYALPLLLVKEDLGLTVAALGVLLAYRGQRKLGAATVIIGLLGTAFALKVAIPAFNSQDQYAYRGRLNVGSADGVFGTLIQVLTQPLMLLTPGTKLFTLLFLFGITAGVALRSAVTIMLLPTLLWRFVSDNPNYWGTAFHYSAVLMPMLFVAFIDGAVRLSASRWDLVRRYGTASVPIVATIAVLLLGQFPLKTLSQPESYRQSSRVKAAIAAMNLIPRGASVESDLGLLSRLASRGDVYLIGKAPGITPSYFVVDSSTGWNPPAPEQLPAYAAAWHPGTAYRVIFTQEGITVLQLQQ